MARHAYAFLILFASLTCGAQDTLCFHPVDARWKDDNSVFHVQGVELLQGGKVIGKIPDEESMDKWAVRVRRENEYSFRYENFFGQKCTMKVIAEQGMKWVPYDMMDSRGLNENQTCGVDGLQVGEQMSITMQSSGCFHSETQSLVINRNKQGYTAKWKGQTRQLDERLLDAVRRFERESYFFSEKSQYGCTTRDQYEVTGPHSSRRWIDDSCDWNGFRWIMTEIFSEEDWLDRSYD